LPTRPKAAAEFFRRRLTSRSDVKQAKPACRSQKTGAMTRRVMLGFARPAASQG